MPASLLVAASAAIILSLGATHLAYTFSGPKLLPRDAALQASMRESTLVITRETTVWKAWIGFNASHGFGAILFGLVYGHLALVHPAFLFQSYFLLAVGMSLLAGYVWLGWMYWFSVPFTGIVIAAACYVAGVTLGLTAYGVSAA